MATKKTKVEVYGETSKYERSMRDVKRVSKSTTQSIGSHWSATFGSLTKLSAAFGIAGAAGFVLLGKSALEAASDLEEMTSKFNVVFGEQTDVAEKWAGTLVDSYAMSTTESLKYLASVQDLLKPMGMQSESAAKLSFEIVKLSADLGSFNNLPTERVMGDIQSALVGNYETMKKYGVVLNATTVQQTALNMGLADTKDKLTAADKAQTAYMLMVNGSADAIGDMARTSDSYANQMKKLNANIVDLKASLGEGLLPIATKIVTQFNEWIKENDRFFKQGLPVYIDAITSSIWGTSKAIDYLLDLMTGPIAGDPKELAKKGLEKQLELSLRSYQLMVQQGNIDQETLRAAEARIFTLRERIAILEESLRIKPTAPPALEPTQATPSLSALTGGSTQDLWQSFGGAETEDLSKWVQSAYGFTQPEEWLQPQLGLVEDMTAEHFRRMKEMTEGSKEEITAILKKQVEEEKAMQQAKLGFYQGIAGNIANTFLQISQAGGQQSEEAFRVYQAFAMAEAGIAAAKAIVLALGSPPGGMLSWAIAATTGSMAAAQIALIASAQPPSYDQGGISTTPGMYYAGIPEAHVPLASGAIPVSLNGGQGGGDTITNIIMENPVFQDLETQQAVFAEIAERIAPNAVVRAYDNDHTIRSRIRSRR